ncbi:glycerophosphodiester phosphodiesterase [Nocardioides sp. zg-DK7169]|uniref:glycerophosphodiester phosphodiesterase n=1 Tax=Nocardioides sp. zg-DK7169 TaxID=2736600 RepID=UPI0015520D48|nr:glycerophosphodiester phosphodiesterase [Nocardioides sp. zg-DK7169]NPC96335.1 glycerophosphodiester phosphodiesterase [Nocardioides sp. zg-DK7169]
MEPSPAAGGAPRVLVSAHRGGAGGDPNLENTRPALERAVTLGVEYVEFDVHRCADGALVLFHDDWLWVDGTRHWLREVPVEALTAQSEHYLRYEEALGILAGRARAHLDLKFTSPGGTAEVAAVRRAVEVLGAENLVVTTLDDRSVRAVRTWADQEGLALLVGLSLGRGVRGLPWRVQARVRISELRPRLRYRASRANVVVANHALARLGVAALARRWGLPLLVWTVDTERSLAYWLRPGRAWMVTTNRPELALAVRERRTRALRGARARSGRRRGPGAPGSGVPGSGSMRA